MQDPAGPGLLPVSAVGVLLSFLFCWLALFFLGRQLHKGGCLVYSERPSHRLPRLRGPVGQIDRYALLWLQTTARALL